MSEMKSLFQFLHRWWNWVRLPHFANDDEMADWFEQADLDAADLPGANVTVEFSGAYTAYNPQSRRLANQRLLDVLIAVWDYVPEQRFGQFVMNLSRTDEGFADTWEWSHNRWIEELEKAHKTWAQGAMSE